MGPAQLARLRTVATAFLRARPWITGPAMAVALIVLWTAPVPRPQLGALGAGMAFMFTFFTLEARYARTHEFSERALFRSLAITAVALGVACAVTGGITSPALPLLFAPSVVSFAAFGRQRRSVASFALLVALVLGLAALPENVPFPPIPSPWAALLLVLFTLTAAVLLLVGVSSLSDAFQRTSTRLERMQDALAEETEARGRTLEAVGARVAHELKNPLTAIKSLVDLLSRGAADDAARSRFAVVGSEIARMEAILREYLDFSRPLSEARPIVAPLDALVDDVLSVLEARASRAGVQLRRDGQPLHVLVDPQLLKQAFLNLLGNALEATSPGGMVRVHWESALERASVWIDDTGHGMDAPVLARVGTPYFTTRRDGTGLGVAVARAIVSQHGGHLRFESAPGRGTSATFDLPLASPAHAQRSGGG